MIATTTEPRNTTYFQFQKKITAYLDGSLSPEETAEFEAFVRTHPEFQDQIVKKQEEFLALRNKMPGATLSKEALESLENEMKLSVLNLLKEEPRNLIDSMKNTWEEWINR